MQLSKLKIVVAGGAISLPSSYTRGYNFMYRCTSWLKHALIVINSHMLRDEPFKEKLGHAEAVKKNKYLVLQK